jgi:hypothetical protein
MEPKVSMFLLEEFANDLRPERHKSISNPYDILVINLLLLSSHLYLGLENCRFSSYFSTKSL